jgi:hypothetical protein
MPAHLVALAKKQKASIYKKQTGPDTVIEKQVVNNYIPDGARVALNGPFVSKEINCLYNLIIRRTFAMIVLPT